MDVALAELPFFPLLCYPEEHTVSQLPFASADVVENGLLPPRPSSVCDACWEGPFAMRFGLPLASPRSEQWDWRGWPKWISYWTSRAKLESRSDTGCVWCRFVLDSFLDKYSTTSFPAPEDRLIIVEIEAGAGVWDEFHVSHGTCRYQKLYIHINGCNLVAFVHTDSDDPAAPYIVTRSPIQDVGSSHALALAKQHIDECIRLHQCCTSSTSPASGSPRLPTRLVDCTDLARPRLVSTLAWEHGEYLALSYVWGKDQVHKTTKLNISIYEEGITPSLLPQTIHDAIYVTNKLGFRWLWIDSLCIIQDSDEDKLHELSHMHHVYLYAHLTIMAGSAKDVSEGFLWQDRSPPDIYPDGVGSVKLPFICPPQPTTRTERQPGERSDSAARCRVGTMTITLEGCLLQGREHDQVLGCMATRAWCMQEYLLSPRSLIFTPDGLLLFRCRTIIGTVCRAPHSTGFGNPQLPKSLFLPIPPTAEPGSTQWGEMHDTWRDVVEDYTRRTASVESDKLVACAAVAELFHRALGSDAYLAGLWRSDLLRHLLWSSKYYSIIAHHSEHLPHTRPAAYRGPSWSWAAIEGVVQYDDDLRVVSYPTSAGRRSSYTVEPLAFVFVEVVDCWVTLEDPALPFGQVTDGALVLRGTLILCPGRLATAFHNFWEVPLPAAFEQARHHHQRLGGLNLDEEDEVYLTEPSECATVILDNEVTDVDELPERLWLVPFGYSRVTGCDDGSPKVYGIVLELTPPSPINSGSEHPEKSLFRRIGYFPTLRYGLTEHPLWDPLVRAAIDGELPRMDIEIV